MNTRAWSVYENIGVNYNKFFKSLPDTPGNANNGSIINYGAELRVLRYSRRRVREMASRWRNKADKCSRSFARILTHLSPIELEHPPDIACFSNWLLSFGSILCSSYKYILSKTKGIRDTRQVKQYWTRVLFKRINFVCIMFVNVLYFYLTFHVT